MAQVQECCKRRSWLFTRSSNLLPPPMAHPERLNALIKHDRDPPATAPHIVRSSIRVKVSSIEDRTTPHDDHSIEGEIHSTHVNLYPNPVSQRRNEPSTCPALCLIRPAEDPPFSAAVCLGGSLSPSKQRVSQSSFMRKRYGRPRIYRPIHNYLLMADPLTGHANGYLFGKSSSVRTYLVDGLLLG